MTHSRIPRQEEKISKAQEKLSKNPKSPGLMKNLLIRQSQYHRVLKGRC